MDIDAHHAGTYVVARLAGISHREAEIIAHAAQYVDDATNEGVIHFDIKPENVLVEDLDGHPNVKLADFGSCHSIYSKPPFTEYISTR